MAKAKKVQKYVPTVKYPAANRDYSLIEDKPEYNDFDHCYSLYRKSLEETPNRYRSDYFSGWDARFRSGEYPASNWKELCGKWSARNMYTTIVPYTPEFKAINDAFMAEYDSREDLQEIYKEAAPNHYYIYDKYGNHHDKTSAEGKKFQERPDSYVMFRNITEGCADARAKIELARETPYQEGDLVLLRDPYIGDRRRDPLYNREYDPVTGARKPTPGREVQRIGTVISVTDKVDKWRASKGSKIIQLIWACKDDPQLENVEEKYIKWHMRPTYKNGLKTRE